MSEILGAAFKYLVALLAVVAVMAILYMVLGSNKTSTATSNIAQTAANVQTMYAGSNSFSSLSSVVNDTNGRKKIFPASMLAGTQIKNVWGGDVTLVVNSSNASQFDMTENMVPGKSCASLATSINYQAINVNGSTLTMPVDPGAAAMACNQDQNTVIFTFGK